MGTADGDTLALELQLEFSAGTIEGCVYTELIIEAGYPPMRVAIIGNSGSGKSTLARTLAAGVVPVLDLDTVAWLPGQIAVPQDPAVAREQLDAFCRAHADWVIEGCYAGLIGAALEHAPHLVFLDPGCAACQTNCRARAWEPHKYASPEEQDARLAFLLDWVADYYTRDGDMSFAAHRALFDEYRGCKQHLVSLPGPDFALAR